MSKCKWSIVIGVVLLAAVAAGGVYFSSGIGEKGAGRIAKIKNFDRVTPEKNDIYSIDDLNSKKIARRSTDEVDPCSTLELYSIDNVNSDYTYSEQFDSFEELFDYFANRVDSRNCRYEFTFVRYGDPHDGVYGYNRLDREIDYECHPMHTLKVSEVAGDNSRRIVCSTQRGDRSSKAGIELSWLRDSDTFRLQSYQAAFISGETHAANTATSATVFEFDVIEHDIFDRVIITRNPL